jgi:hypothetical protein
MLGGEGIIGGCPGRLAASEIVHMLRSVAIVIAVHASLLGSGCTTSGTTQERQPVPRFESVRADADGLSATLVRVLAPGGTASDLGWLECELSLENRGDAPLVVSTVKLLTKSGRYLPAAAAYGETLSSPDPAYELAGNVATSAAGVAAGQLIPYGGLVVQAIAGVAGASSADARAKAEQQFRLRRVDGVELAAGGRMEGSSFFPRVPDPEALVVDFSQRGKVQRATLPLSHLQTP